MVDASSGPQPVICVGAECNNGNFTCAEYLSYVETVLKRTVQQECLGFPLEWHVFFGDLTFFNLLEGVTTVEADGFLFADLCPAECSEVVSRVSHAYYKYSHAVSYELSRTARTVLAPLSYTAGRTPLPERRQRAHRIVRVSARGSH